MQKTYYSPLLTKLPDLKTSPKVFFYLNDKKIPTILPLYTMINVLLIFILSKKPSFLNQLISISLPEQISFYPIFSRHFENQISDPNKSHGPHKICICMIM